MSEPGRLHAFDGLRATLALLFVVLHASLAYTMTPLGALWPYKDPATHFGFDVLVLFLHTFRLPLFFVLAGFFGAKVHAERGARGFVLDRVRRVALPLAAAWIIVTPITLLAARVPLQWFHLWFLADLILYYVAALAAAFLWRRAPEPWKRSASRGMGALVPSPWLPVVLIAVTAVTLWPMRSGVLETPGTFRRPLPTLAADAVFILFGWGVYGRPEALAGIARRAWTHVALGGLSFLIYLTCLKRLLAGMGGRAATLIALSATTWLLGLGVLGLFQRYYRRPYRTGRLLADASYWLYLAHFPFVVWIPLYLRNLPWPAFAKFTAVALVTTGACLGLYVAFVAIRSRLRDRVRSSRARLGA